MTDRPPITQEMIALYDDYTHVTLDRRRFMARLSRLAGGAAAAAALVPLLEANAARAAIIASDDARVKASTVDVDAPHGPLTGYRASPADAAGPLPAVLVIHENRGLNPHIEDVARRTALAGFLAFAPDFLAPIGGTPADSDKAREMIYTLDPAQTLANALAALAALRGDASSTGKVGAVGFCWGGAMVNQLAVNAPDLDAGVAFYGRVPEVANVPQIEARMMLHYAGLDDRINAGMPAYREALEAAGVDHVVHVYDGVNHAFHNDTSAARYDRAAAELAWSRTIAFFEETLD